MDMSGDSASTPPGKTRRRLGPTWDAASVRTLRRHLGLTQRGMAQELGTRQQTVSEWETGLYRPRGASARLLTIIGERAGFQYQARSAARETRRDDDAGAP
jgi:DNA-binding transcriptional regulator YiaG